MQELKIGEAVFPFETQKEEKTCEVVRLPDQGQLAPAVELGRIVERAHVKVCSCILAQHAIPKGYEVA